MLAMVVNDIVGSLMPRVVCDTIASMLAPTGELHLFLFTG
jgi:hypothetical protein